MVFVPARIPSHRGRPYASAAHRFAMTALARGAASALADVRSGNGRRGPFLHGDHARPAHALGRDTSGLFVLTGADAFADIRTWKNYPAVLDRCHFVAVSRPGFPVARLRAALPELAARMQPATAGVPDCPAILLVDAPTADVSATAIRRRAAAGEPLTGFVPAAVAAYIQKHQLYSETTPKGLHDHTEETQVPHATPRNARAQRSFPRILQDLMAAVAAALDKRPRTWSCST